MGSIFNALNLHQITAEKILDAITHLSFLQLLILWVTGSVLVGMIKVDGWRATMPFYIIKCPHHGLQMSYPSGFDKKLACPKCLNDSCE